MNDYLVGKVIDNRYEVVKKIGTGGMATVYKAKCHVLNRYVALKVLKDSLKYDTDVVKKFNTESRAAARLSHPNIVQVYDVGEGSDLDYIVMEYVDGITLKEYIRKNGKLSAEEACDIAAKIGRALDCAHTNGIVHRDIKPHNVLMGRDGSIKVADFGIAQATSSETLVATSGGMGSVHYISPEQARGGFTNERSDIYSLGIVLYEMLTGEVPFDGANPVSVALAKLEKDPKDLRIINPYVPDKVADIAMKAISKEQHSRYQSAAGMVSDLEAAVGITSQYQGDAEGRFETRRLDDKLTKEEYTSRRGAGSAKKEQAGYKKIAAAAVALAAVLGLLTYFVFGGGTKEYQVPEVINLTVEEAEKILKDAELRLNENIEFEPSDEVEEGLIIKQEPGFNQYVKKNRKIKVTVSSGPEDGEIKVPDVENLKFEEAEKRILSMGFECVKVEEFHEEIALGYVIKQSPKSGDKASKGDKITVYVSADVEDPNAQAVVPKVTGLTEAEARAAIEKAGLSVGAVDTKESTSKEGTVIAQTPAAKTGVEKGSKVDIVVSVAAPVETPSPTPAMTRKTLTITIPDDANETVHIKVVANGKTIYDKTHQKSEVTVDIPVQSSKDASVQAYIDGKLVVDRVIAFD